jgi:hypothetical protein
MAWRRDKVDIFDKRSILAMIGDFALWRPVTGSGKGSCMNDSDVNWLKP